VNRLEHLRRAAPFATILVTVLLVFGNSLFSDFVWDDETIILSRAEFLGDASNIPTVLTSADSTDSDGGGSPYYRPLSLLSFMLDTWLWGHDPFGYHLENLLLHALVAVLVFLLAEAVFGDRVLAWLAAMLFAVHPVDSEAVSFVSARNNLLCAAFFFASLLTLWRSRRAGVRWVFGALVWFFGSLLCKEPAVAIPAFLASLALFSRDRRLAAKGSVLAAFFAVLVGYLVIRLAVLGVFTSEAGVDLSAERLRLMASAGFENLRLLVLPFRLNAHYTRAYLGFDWVRAAAACAGVGGLILLSVWPRSPEPVRVGALWTLCGLVPISNLVAIPSAPVAERYLYAVVPGIALAAAWPLRAALRWHPRAAGVAIAVVLVVLGGTTFRRNRVWADNLTLDASMVQADPANSIARMHLGISYGRQGRAADAERELRESLRLNPANPRAHYNLAALLLAQDRIDEAALANAAALRLDPDFARARSSMGVILARQGRLDEAVRALEAAVKRAPDSAEGHNNLGMVYGQLGRHAEALAEFETAARLRPDLAATHLNVGRAHARLGHAAEAQQAFRRAAELDPRYAPVPESAGEGVLPAQH